VDDLIEKGENEKVEFKSSLWWDFKLKNKNRTIELAVAKAVQSFLNSEDGGCLLIGVRDDKTLLGLEADFNVIEKLTTDAFELHFTNIIENYLGAENRPYVTMRFAERKGKQLAVVVIPKKAPKPVFLTVDGEPSFNIRSGNSSRPLNVKEATEYIRQHWEKT
jgi:predicted HTH transcriptional regulator